MKKIQRLNLIFFLCISSFAFGQEKPSITFTTTRAIDSNITITFGADSADRPDIWIDWNNNGVRDGNEGVADAIAAAGKNWGYWTGANQVAYKVTTQTINIYGKVKQLGLYRGNVTSIDITNNPGMTYLNIQDNQITGELDLTGQTELYHIQAQNNGYGGVLDISNMSKLQQVNIDRNNLTGIIMNGEYPVLRQFNFSRNFISSANIDHILNHLPAEVVGATQGNFYVVNTATSNSHAPEGNQLHQHHLNHPVFTGKWAPLDVRYNGKTKISNISDVTNFYKISFTTEKAVSSQITLNIAAEELDKAEIWIDLNENGTKDAGEGVTTFGTDATYTTGSQNIAVYGRVRDIKFSGNELTKFDYLQNAFYNYTASIDLSNNKINDLRFTANYLRLLENLNIAGNNLTTVNITNIINKLADRNSTTPGTVTLINLAVEDGNMAINDHVTLANAKNYVVKDAAGNTLTATSIPLRDQSLETLTPIETYQANEILLPEKTDQGLPVIYTMEAGKGAIATLDGNKVTTIRHGSVKITATQAGDASFKPFTKTVSITVLPAGDVFNWLEVPTLSVIGDYVTLVGPAALLSHFTKLFINGQEVEMVGYEFDLTGYSGTLEVKATSDDGTYMTRVTVEK
ncbi:MAG: hypothetical protein LLF81_01820 [Porphyromonadaceae bacterium]|nr:hypothetical protein [Porphyromonadaceae bacterium]